MATSSSSSSLLLSQDRVSVLGLENNHEDDSGVKRIVVRKLIEALNSARGNGTSMISLIIRPGDQISECQRLLTEEYGKAERIKSRVNRLSVQAAITSTQQTLKLYTKVPANGLAVFCGTVLLPSDSTTNNKEKLICRAFEPFKPLTTSGYLCDNRFHTEALQQLLESDEKFGFIVIDGCGALFATLCGGSKEVLYKLTVTLPKKHGRGGQSALRFARLRLESRHNYLRRVSELATQLFISNDRPNIRGLVLAGSADFKTELAKSDLFDSRLSGVVLKMVDVGYGGENGLHQAIELSAEDLSNVKFVQEVKLIAQFFDEISQDTQKVAYGIEDTMRALEMGAVHTLIVWDELEMTRRVVKNTATGELMIEFLQPDHATTEGHKKGTFEVVESCSVVDWFTMNFQKWGCKLAFVSNRSQEGTQFSKGFGGIGALLRYQVDFVSYNESDVMGGGDEGDGEEGQQQQNDDEIETPLL